MKFLWISRHPPQPVQVAELEEVFGEVEIIQVSTTVKDASEVASLMQEHQADDLVAVLPIALLSDLTRMGIKPIRAVMERKVESEEVTFTHSHFERIERVEVVFHSLRGVRCHY